MAKILKFRFCWISMAKCLLKSSMIALFIIMKKISLSEIAENEGISRQGVRDSIKRAEAQLFDMEERLGLAKRFNEMKKGIDEIVECADNINEYNLNHTLSMEVNDNVARIKTLASFLKEG